MGEPAALFEFGDDDPALANEPGMFELFHEQDHPFKARDPKARRKLCKHCGKGRQNAEHWGAPPSTSHSGSGSDFHTYQNIKHKWQEILTALMEEAGVPKPLGRVSAEGKMCFPTMHPRDQSNFRYMLEKALGDALTEGGWLLPSSPGAKDDDCFFPVVKYEFGGLTATYEKGVSWVRVMLFTDTVPGECI